MSRFLQRLQCPISEPALVDALRKADELPVNELSSRVDLSELDQTIQILKEISNNDRKLVELVNDLIVSCILT